MERQWRGIQHNEINRISAEHSLQHADQPKPRLERINAIAQIHRDVDVAARPGLSGGLTAEEIREQHL